MNSWGGNMVSACSAELDKCLSSEKDYKTCKKNNDNCFEPIVKLAYDNANNKCGEKPTCTPA